MTKLILIILIAVISLNGQTEINNTQKGVEAPVFSLPNMDNEYIALRDLCGEKLRKPWKNKTKYVVVLSFFASWCKPCIAEIPHLQTVMNNYKNQNIKFYLVNVGEEKEKIQEFLKSNDVDIPILLDKYKKVSEKYDALKLPRLVVIDKMGIVQLEKRGFTDGKKFETELNDVINSLIHN